MRLREDLSPLSHPIGGDGGIVVVSSDRDHDHAAAADDHGRVILRMMFAVSSDDKHAFAEFVLMKMGHFLRVFEFHPQRETGVSPEYSCLGFEKIVIKRHAACLFLILYAHKSCNVNRKSQKLII